MIECVVSQYGDRVKDAPGCALRKIGMNVYRLVIPDGPKPFVFATPLTEHRVAVVDRMGPLVFDVRTFNTLNGFHPGSALRVRVYREGEPDLLATGVFTETGLRSENTSLGLWRDGTKKMVEWHAPDGEVLVQPQGRLVQHAVVERVGNKASIETLITRTPATPLETNIEIAVVRNLGPIRGR